MKSNYNVPMKLRKFFNADARRGAKSRRRSRGASKNVTRLENAFIRGSVKLSGIQKWVSDRRSPLFIYIRYIFGIWVPNIKYIEFLL